MAAAFAARQEDFARILARTDREMLETHSKRLIIVLGQFILIFALYKTEIIIK